MATETRVNVLLKVLKFENKNQSSLFCLKDVPAFNSVEMFKRYLVEKHAAEISPAKGVNSFEIGYYGPRGRKFSIRTEDHLREAYLKESLNYVSFWLDPFPLSTAPKEKALSRKRGSVDDDELICLDFKATGSKKTNVAKEDNTCFNSYLSRLRQTHGSKMADFKLKCWARMLVNGSHRNETEPPNASFFELEPRGAAKSSTATSTCSTIIQPSKQERDSSEVNEVQVKARGLILQQLVELKNLKDANILNNEEFEEQKKKMLEDLKKL